ncbi:hypothetical protein K438DRAFT_1850965, partial [Mycena galopus ATCC 62051]
PGKRKGKSVLGLPFFTVATLQHTSHQFLQHVRSIFVEDQDQETLASWLPACTGVTNLFSSLHRALWVYSAALPTSNISRLAPPYSLALPFRFTCPSPSHTSSSWLARTTSITHAQPSPGSHLTHLALNVCPESRLAHAVLCGNAQLRCIVFLTVTTLHEGSPLLDDSRFVCIDENVSYYLDWLKGAVTGNDYWALADAFIAARPEGRTD